MTRRLNHEPLQYIEEYVPFYTIQLKVDQRCLIPRPETEFLIELIKENTKFWLDVLQPADIWCSEVLDWDKMMKNEGFKIVDMLQRITRSDGLDIQTLRCPIRIDNQIFKSEKAAPIVGQDTKKIIQEFSL